MSARSPREAVLERGAWREASYQERLDGLRAMEERLADEQGREAAVVEPAVLEPNTLGQYQQGGGPGGKDRIEIGPGQIADDDPREAVDTIAHEGRHAYQYDCASRPDQHPEVSPQTADAWRENFKPENYKKAETDGYEEYRYQPIEADAHDYADKVTEEMYGKESSQAYGGPASDQPSASDRAAAYRPAGWAREPDEPGPPAQARDSEMSASERAAVNRPSPPPPPPPPEPDDQDQSETRGRGR